MDDLVININIDETNQHQQFVLETFLGKIKSLKSKEYSGLLRKIDIFSLKEESISLNCKTWDTLINIYKQIDNKQLRNYQYLFQEENILQIFNNIGNYSVYFSSKGAKMFRVNKYINNEAIVYINNSSKKGFYRGTIKIKNNTTIITNNAKFIQLSDGKIYLFDNNNVYFLKDICNMVGVYLDVEMLNLIAEKKWSSNTNVLKKYYLKYRQKSDKNLLQKHIEKDVYTGDISPVLYLKIGDKNIVTGSLNFRYDLVEIDAFSMNEYLVLYNKKYSRDKNFEIKYLSILSQNHWEKYSNQFIYKGNDINKDIDNLINNKTIVLSEKKDKVFTKYSYSYNISYSIDWFSIEASIKINEKVHYLTELLKKTKKGQRWVEIDNNIVFLPTEIIEKTKNIDIKNNDIFLEKKYVGDVLEFAKNFQIEKINNIEGITEFKNIKINISKQFLGELRNYQIEGVKWLLYLYENKFGGCLADDMGLGKTIQIIAFLSDRKIRTNKHSSLIVVPKTLIFNWKKELSKFNPEISVNIYYGANRNIDCDDNKFDIILTTYGMVLNDKEKFSKFFFDCIIIDEAQYIKNSTSKTYRAVSSLNANIKIALTGTPIENNITELWSLMNLLNKNILGSKKEFLATYSLQEKLKSLNTKISPFLLRRTKNQVLYDLPKKTESVIYCTMEEKQKELYEAVLINIKEELKRNPNRYQIKSNSDILVGLLHLRQISCHPKLLEAQYNINHALKSGKFEVLKNIVNDLYNKNEKIVIFSQFTKMLKIIEKWVRYKKYKCFYLDGKTNNRQKVIENYEKAINGILLISLKAGGVGINLTSASYAIIYDPWWNPAVENQAADRLYRIGQKRNVIIYKLITNNSIEEKVNDLKKLKIECAETLLDSQNIIKNLTIQELKSLLD